MINFSNSLFYYDPFPHSVIKDFLDIKFYEGICSEFPPIHYLQKIQEKENIRKFNKLNLSNNFKQKKDFKKFISSTFFIKSFYNYLISKNFIENLNNFLVKNYIDLRLDEARYGIINKIIYFFKDFENKIDFEFSAIPVDSGYIKPHTDGGNKIIGFVIPIIDNDTILECNNLGTKILYSSKNEYKYNFYNKTVPAEHTTLVRELPFKKNQISLHIKTHNSLHSVGPLKTNTTNKEIFRKSISFFVLK